MSNENKGGNFSPEIAERRLEAALRGARLVGSTSAKSMTQKKPMAHHRKVPDSSASDEKPKK